MEKNQVGDPVVDGYIVGLEFILNILRACRLDLSGLA
jgi:hypothetical protein